jgi:hypothetical protein
MKSPKPDDASCGSKFLDRRLREIGFAPQAIQHLEPDEVEVMSSALWQNVVSFVRGLELIPLVVSEDKHAKTVVDLRCANRNHARIGGTNFFLGFDGKCYNLYLDAYYGGGYCFSRDSEGVCLCCGCESSGEKFYEFSDALERVILDHLAMFD